MDLSHPERTLTGRLDLPILSVLARAERDWTTGQIARNIGATTVGVREALQRLHATGLVHAVVVGRAKGYRLNTSHVMADPLRQLCRADASLRARIVAEIEQWEVRPVSVVIFGSWARGEAGPDSDVDLLLIHPAFQGDVEGTADRRQWEDQLDILRQQIRVWSGNSSDLLSFSVSEWLQIKRRGDALAQTFAREDTVLLFGVPPRAAAMHSTLQGDRA